MFVANCTLFLKIYNNYCKNYAHEPCGTEIERAFEACKIPAGNLESLDQLMQTHTIYKLRAVVIAMTRCCTIHYTSAAGDSGAELARWRIAMRRWRNDCAAFFADTDLDAIQILPLAAAEPPIDDLRTKVAELEKRMTTMQTEINKLKSAQFDSAPPESDAIAWDSPFSDYLGDL